MKVYIQFDFEGIAGFVVRDNRDHNEPQVMERFLRYRRIAAMEVSAAVNAAFEAGADDVIVWDSHGSGITLPVEELPERTQLITGEYRKGPWLPFLEGTDIGIYLGGHAMAGTPRATVPHTLMTLNDKAYGEVGMFINCCGGWNIPVVMVSGDLAVKKEVEYQIPASEIVVTKEALGPTLVKTITPQLSCKLIAQAVKDGIARAGKIEPFHLEPPFTFKASDGSEDWIYDRDGDMVNAYRMYLKERYGYESGWPDYNLREN